jgi:hypothetical protein
VAERNAVQQERRAFEMLFKEREEQLRAIHVSA